MAKIVPVTQADGNEALINADAVTYVITPNANIGANPNARAVIYFGSQQQLAVKDTVADIKAKL